LNSADINSATRCPARRQCQRWRGGYQRWLQGSSIWAKSRPTTCWPLARWTHVGTASPGTPRLVVYGLVETDSSSDEASERGPVQLVLSKKMGRRAGDARTRVTSKKIGHRAHPNTPRVRVQVPAHPVQLFARTGAGCVPSTVNHANCAPGASAHCKKK